MIYFCFSDIHGEKELFDKIYSYLKSLKEHWKCIFLGDACDRGEDGYSIIKTLLSDERFIYLKGNHEDMFVKAACDIKDFCQECNFKLTPAVLANGLGSVELHLWNGGRPTLLQWIKEGGDMRIIGRLSKLPIKYSIDKYDLCHSGCTKDSWQQENCDPAELFWNRSHFYCSWFKDRILVHGHTPIQHMIKKYYRDEHFYHNNILEYENNTKICIDNGAFATKEIALLNLNTKEVINFSTT